MNIQELRDQKGRLAEQADQILKAAATESRYDLKPDEEQQFDAIHADIDRISGHIARIEKQEALNATEGRKTEPPTPDRRGGDQRLVRPHFTEALRSWLLGGSNTIERTPAMRAAAEAYGFNLDSHRVEIRLPGAALRGTTPDAIREWEERAALGTTSGAVGQYTVPDEAMRALEIALLAYGGMRQVATIYRTDSGGALPIPTVNDTSNKGVILSENTQAAELEFTFGQLVLDSYKYSSKYILCSVELLQDSAINVAQFIGNALGERIARITNEHFTTGTGTSQPKGIVTAATLGVTVAHGQTSSLLYEDLVDCEHAIDPAYRRNARWMFCDATLKAIKKLKLLQYSGDTTGAPLWLPGLASGQPDTILGYPFTINQDVATLATSSKSVLFGDFSKYIIRDVRDVTLLRLEERFADYHQVGFLAFSRHDGDLLDAGTNPVKYIQMHDA